MDLREWNRFVSTRKKHLNPTGKNKNTYVFLIDKYFEDARQEEKHVLDLLEAIMRPTDPMKKSYGQFWLK